MSAVGEARAPPLAGQIVPLPPMPLPTRLLVGACCIGGPVVVTGLAAAGGDHRLVADDVDAQVGDVQRRQARPARLVRVRRRRRAAEGRPTREPPPPPAPGGRERVAAPGTRPAQLHRADARERGAGRKAGGEQRPALAESGDAPGSPSPTVSLTSAPLGASGDAARLSSLPSVSAVPGPIGPVGTHRGVGLGAAALGRRLGQDAPTRERQHPDLRARADRSSCACRPRSRGRGQTSRCSRTG